MKLKKTIAACAAALGLLGMSTPADALLGLDLNALNPTYTKTKYPIVLVHGLFGFDNIVGIDYFYGVKKALTSGGAKVYIVQLSAAASHKVRGEQLLQQLQAIQAADPTIKKFNLVGHSQGGLASRYVAGVKPELVASVTQVQTPNQGSKTADWLVDLVLNAPLPEAGSQSIDLLGLAVEVVGAIEWLSDSPYKSDKSSLLANIVGLTTTIAPSFNASYPAGAPTTECGSGPRTANGINWYSVGGTKININLLDISDLILAYVGKESYGTEPNDGLVGRCSSHWGEVLRDDYPWNHLDGINQVFGIVGLTAPDPLVFYRTQANRLKGAGL